VATIVVLLTATVLLLSAVVVVVVDAGAQRSSSSSGSSSSSVGAPRVLLNNTVYSVLHGAGGGGNGNGNGMPQRVHIVPGRAEHAQCIGRITRTQHVVGFSELRLEAMPTFSAMQQAYAAGYLEAALSANEIWTFMSNFLAWELFALVRATPLHTYFETWLNATRLAIQKPPAGKAVRSSNNNISSCCSFINLSCC
jgi:hypothetical protein